MSVTTKHPSFFTAEDTWQSLRDAYAGSGAVKSRASTLRRGDKNQGTRYLPRPAGMKQQEQYDAYRGRAVWYGATERAVHGLAGAVFRRPPQVVGPDAMETHLNDITLTGVPLTSFAEQTIRETLLMGRAGILVEFPRSTPDEHEEAIPPPATSRPYWVLWGTEEIINWRTEHRQGDTVLTLVVLKECLEEPQGVFPSPDYFTLTTVTQYRVLRLDEQGRYEVSLWRERAQGRAARSQQPVVDMHDLWIPQRAGEPLPFIPFCFLAPFSLEPGIEKSLLEALVEVNYQYYRHSADYEHGLHLTALPTPWVTGHSPDSPTLEIGSATAWVIPNADAKVGMLEFQGSGLQPHEKALDADVKNMAALGARLLEGQPLVAETATAVLRRTEGSESPVQSLISTTSMALTKALQWHSWWHGSTETPTDETISVTLNKDLLSVNLEPAMLKELVAAWLSGAISYETLYQNLQKGEIARPGIPVDEEQALIEVEQAARSTGALLPLVTANGTGG